MSVTTYDSAIAAADNADSALNQMRDCVEDLGNELDHAEHIQEIDAKTAADRITELEIKIESMKRYSLHGPTLGHLRKIRILIDAILINAPKEDGS